MARLVIFVVKLFVLLATADTVLRQGNELQAAGYAIVAWECAYPPYNLGQCDTPAPNANFGALSGGGWHNLGLKTDGTLVAWGRNDYGQCDVPSPNADFVAVSASHLHSLSLKTAGSIVAWGDNHAGQCDVPAPNSNFVAVAAGGTHSLVLQRRFAPLGGCPASGRRDDPLSGNSGLWRSAAGRVSGFRPT